MEKSGSKLSRFILGSTAEIPRLINDAKDEGRLVLLFGVSYSLLDLMELDMDLSSCIVIETGGMKGRRKELSKSEMHQLLKKELNIFSFPRKDSPQRKKKEAIRREQLNQLNNNTLSRPRLY